MVGNRHFTSEPLSQEVFSAYRDLIYSLLSKKIPDVPTRLSISPEANELVAEYFYSIESMLQNEVAMKNWLSKHVGTMLRIAGNLHLASSESTSPVITRKTIENAIKISQYFGIQARYSFISIRGQEELNKAKDVLSVIAKNTKGKPITRREIFRHGGNRGLNCMEELCPYLEILEDFGYIHQFTEFQEGKGRPKQLVLLNPNYKT